jgi:hypothetical protein
MIKFLFNIVFNFGLAVIHVGTCHNIYDSNPPNDALVCIGIFTLIFLFLVFVLNLMIKVVSIIIEEFMS